MTREEIITAQIAIREQLNPLQVEMKEADANFPWSDDQIVRLQFVQDEINRLNGEMNALTRIRPHF